MAIKTIHLDENDSIHDWIEENRSIILDALYGELFDFLDSDDKRREVLKVKIHYKEIPEHANMRREMTFVMTKERVDETIQQLIEWYSELEEYEKCAVLSKINL